MAAVVTSAVASVLGTFLPMTPPMAPPSGYHTPPVPPVTMLKESFCWADADGAATVRPEQTEDACNQCQTRCLHVDPPR